MESQEVKQARLEERLNVIVIELQQARDGRKQQYEKIEEVNRNLMNVHNRLEQVEKKLAAAGPTIEEFVIIKHKIEGAGRFGKWLWGGLGVALSMAFTARESIFHWFSR